MDFYQIEPLKRAGKVVMNAPRNEVRAAMGGKFVEFDNYDENTVDDFESCHIYYDKDNRVKGVEIWDDGIAEYNGKNLFLMDCEDIIQHIDSPYIKEDDGLLYPELGIAIGFNEGKVYCIYVRREKYDNRR